MSSDNVKDAQKHSCVAKLTSIFLFAAAAGILQHGCCNAQTPRNLEEIFIGRCYEYEQVLYTQWMDKQKNCSDLWQKFYSSFAYKDPCSLDVYSYDEFIAASRHNISTYDKTQYWSGQVTPLIYEYTARARRYVTIREYLPGYTVQDVYEWCGKLESESEGPGMDFESCPAWGSCGGDRMTPAESFWKGLSTAFAHIVEGNVRVLLNGSNGQAYRNYSTFGGYELTNLNASRNPILYVQLIHDILPREASVTETCVNGTLLQLKADTEKKGIVFDCTDDPTDLLYLQCVDYVGTPRCLPIGSVTDGQHRPNSAASLDTPKMTQIVLVLSTFLFSLCRWLQDDV